MAEAEGMAEGDEIASFFGGHDSGKARGGEDVAFGDVVALDFFDGFGLEADFAASDGFALLDGLRGNVNHGDVALFVEVSEVAHVRFVTKGGGEFSSIR